MLFTTRITELFGIRLPILAGGLQWLATPDYVAAAVKAGIMGFMTAGSFPDDATLRDAIRRLQDLTGGKPFGVNISMLPKIAAHERVERIVDVVAEEGVAFVETAGRNPAAYLPRLKAAGVKVVHKVPSVPFAEKAQAIGVDAVAIVGYECGGHPGLDVIGTFVQAATAARRLTIPYVIGGGVGTGSHLVAALALGAEGVVVGTRFLAADEIDAHERYKEALLEAAETDTRLILQSLRNTIRVYDNETARTVAAIEARGEGSLDTLMPLVAGKVGRESYRTGEIARGALAVGQAVAFVDRCEPLAAIIARFESEARAALGRLDERHRAPSMPQEHAALPA